MNIYATWEQFEEKYPSAAAQSDNTARQQSEKDAWHEQRRGRITGSTLGKLFTSTYAIAKSDTVKGYVNERKAEQLGFERRVSYTTKDMQHGIDNEPIALQLFEIVLGEKVTPNSDFIVHKELDKYGATPDAFVESKNAVVEVKCPYNAGIHIAYMRLKTWMDVKLNLKDYYLQIQSEMHVTGRDICYFVSYCPHEDIRLSLHYVVIPRDAELIAAIESVVKSTTDLILADV